jgi:C4-dicarboxylate-specific signal transduction histidine kinase
MSGKRPGREAAREVTDGPSTLAATLWLLAGLGGFLAFFLTVEPSRLEKPPALVAIYLVCAVTLDLFVGASRRVSLQRISPAVVLALLVTPGVPYTVALVADLMATLVLVISSGFTTATVAQAGRSLLPAVVTAWLLARRETLDLNAYFLAAEAFLVVALLTRSSDPPFRNDVFLVVSFPALALMLRSLAELSLAYVLLTIPLLFLLTTVDTDMLLRYFQLQKQLDSTKTQVIATDRARQVVERESRRKGVLLERREKQLELLNGLGRQLDDAKASEDLGRFLVQECRRLISADVALVLFVDSKGGGRVGRLISDLPEQNLGLRPGEPLPALIRSGMSGRAPWDAPLWTDKKSFLSVPLGNEGWLLLAHREADAFPEFLEGFFSAVGRHAGSAALAIRRLTEVRELARREAAEKELVAREKEKVAEQNQNLRSLIASFDSLTEASLSSDAELMRQGRETIRQLTGAERVIFRAPELDQPGQRGLVFEDKEWPSFLYLKGSGPAGNVLCLASRPGCFAQSHLEWCTLLRDFLDKTLENSTLHRRITSSLTQLKETQAEVVRSSQWAAAGRLAANAAHELNTPLGAIRLAAEQVKYFQGESAPEPAKQGLASIIRSVDRCREVTDRLLITSRPVDHGEATATRPGELSLMPVLRDAVASVQPYLRASDIKLASHRLTGEYTVFAVLQDLYWAVVNLLKNSVDAVVDGVEAGQRRMAVAVEAVGDVARITVVDNGPGIPEELRDRVFEPFFTTKKIGSGNGLGLALSRQNLGKWGGSVYLGEPPVGGGACFVIEVPLAGSPTARRIEQSASVSQA